MSFVFVLLKALALATQKFKMQINWVEGPFETFWKIHPNWRIQLGNNFKNVRNWRSVCQKNNTPNEISSGFNTVDMFSMYVWHVHNVETLLKLVLGIWGRYLRMFFEIIISVQWIWCVTTIHVRVLGEVINMTRRGDSQPNQLIAEVNTMKSTGENQSQIKTILANLEPWIIRDKKQMYKQAISDMGWSFKLPCNAMF